MIRKLHPVAPATPRGFQKLLGAVLVAAAAAAAPVHAGTIDFEGYAGPVGGGESWEQAGYSVAFFANIPGDGVGTLVGQFVDGDESTCDTSSMACPANISGTYYAALNDGLLDITFNDGPGFQLKSFDASFVGGSSTLSSYPAVAGLLRVQGWTATGFTTYQDFLLDGPTSAGFRFGHFVAPEAFAKNVFVETAFFGFTCNSAGNCNAFTTNRGQFAIDNIELADVPEPATAAIVGLGLLGLGAARRRRNS